MIATLKNYLIPAVRFSTRAYVRYAPWSLGKKAVHSAFAKYIGWRPHQDTVRTVFGSLMSLSMPDSIANSIFLTGQWEPAITRYISNHARAGDIFIDVGANVGYYTLLASRIVGAGGHVFAIEASSSIYDRLNANISLNRCTNVTALHAAAAAEPGSLPVFLGTHANLGHTTTVETLAKAHDLALEGTVRADTLDRLLGTANVRAARMIKIDVEGGEAAVLQPLFASLGDFSSNTEWLLELSPGFAPGGQRDIDRMYHAFASAGYRAYAFPRDSWLVNHPPSGARLVPLGAPPSDYLCDVLMTRATDLIEL